jgi:hypothetical protein
MSRTHVFQRIAVTSALLGLLGLTACSGGGDAAPDGADPVAEVAEGLDAARLEQGWPIQYAKVESFADFQSRGWITLVQKRNLRDSAESLGQGPGGARAHAEAASLFKQAALVSANAAIQTYAETPQETDPVGAAHLLAVAYALHGDLDKAREASARLDAVDDVTTKWHAPWKAWLSGDAAWPPDLSGLPLELPEPAPGVWPVLEGVPHYEMPVQAEGDHAQPMGDPGSLVALALWHEAAARASNDDGDAIATYTARYRFPVESTASTAELPMHLVYASDLLVPADGAFLADLTGEKGAAAVDAHADTSLVAYLASQARQDGKVNSETAADLASAVREQVKALASAKTENTVERHHVMFADIAYTGILRNLALVAEAEGQREEGGKLRLLAMEASQEHTGDPVALMSLSAWDAGNRYPSRAQEIIHQNSQFYPSLEAARFGLDVLALRVGRERVETPGM